MNRRPGGYRRGLGAGTVALATAISVTAHALALYAARDALREPGEQTDQTPIRLVEAPQPEPPPEPEPTQEPEPEPEVLAPEPPPPPPSPVRRPRPVAEAPSPPPPEPVAPPPQVSPPTPVRRDLTRLALPRMGNTGGGWAVPYGNAPLRSGVVDPQAKPATPAVPTDEPAATTPTPAPAPNRRATRLPTAQTPIVRPRRLSAPEPVFPPQLRQQGIEGDVVLLATIDAQGRVVEVVVVKSSGHAEFDAAAVAAAKAARYSPATRGGKAFQYAQRYTVRFRIRD